VSQCQCRSYGDRFLASEMKIGSIPNGSTTTSRVANAVRPNFSVHNSVSKTINLPARRETRGHRAGVLRAWQLDLKGTTIHRYGSKSSQVLEFAIGEEAHHFDHASRCDPDECRI
jgi:hypothetical protein